MISSLTYGARIALFGVWVWKILCWTIEQNVLGGARHFIRPLIARTPHMAGKDSAVGQVAACVRKVARTYGGAQRDLRAWLAQLEAALVAKKRDLKASNTQMKKWCRCLGVCARNGQCYYAKLGRVLEARPGLTVDRKLMKRYPTLRYVLVQCASV